MNKPFTKNDIREFCLCHLDDFVHIKSQFLNNMYVSINSRVFVWKVLTSNKILNLVNTNYDEYIDKLQKSTATSMTIEIRNEIWNSVLLIYI